LPGKTEFEKEYWLKDANPLQGCKKEKFLKTFFGGVGLRVVGCRKAAKSFLKQTQYFVCVCVCVCVYECVHAL
jgi:hypothetical protein